MLRRLTYMSGLISALMVGFVAHATTEKSPAEFYKDNVITLILGAGPGGG